MPGAFIFGCAGPVLGPDEKRFFRQSDPFGFILFARNVENAAQLRRLTADLRACVGRDAPVLIDQEGGRVARLRGPVWREWLPALRQIERTATTDPMRAMWLRYRLIAAELRAVGVDTDCAPLADIATKATHPILRDRCYGFTVDSVAGAACAVASGLLAGGVLPVLKHLPGHGRPDADSHKDLPVTAASLDDLEASDFEAFRRLSFLPMGMTAHVVYEALDKGRCATLSPVVIGHIRNGIGFDGLLMSDDLSMSALRGGMGARARAALDAGCDVVLHCNGERGEMDAVAAAAGEMGDHARLRAGRALAFRGGAEAIDEKALLDELDSLLC